MFTTCTSLDTADSLFDISVSKYRSLIDSTKDGSNALKHTNRVSVIRAVHGVSKYFFILFRLINVNFISRIFSIFNI